MPYIYVKYEEVGLEILFQRLANIFLSGQILWFAAFHLQITEQRHTFLKSVV